jgi:LmeA-like phospholipid-binding
VRGCLRAIGNFILTLVLLATLIIAAGQVYLLPRLDKSLADAVRREYLLPPSSTVTIKRGSVLDTMEGQVESFYVESREAQIDGIPVEDLKFVAEGVSFDLPQTLLTQRAELKELNNGRLSFKVSEKALAERWIGELQGAGLSKVEVHLTPGNVELSGLFDLAMIKVRVGAKGKLSTDGERIRFDMSDLQLGDSNIGVGALNAVFSKLAPAVDLGQFKVGMHSVNEGFLAVQASSRSLDDLEKRMERGVQPKDNLMPAGGKAELKSAPAEGSSADDEPSADSGADKSGG